ncbi:hypothetical protein [Streptomyces cavernicola]|uniref:RDD domain-containing protein n=1 Tax=Streptomyces cavernicola TaxID=3043613 RepID=A0ABT6SIB5_9ACTN|nr:hypothetical protein [Streptomyces sp. B-S-A6]MDI3406991.1 hypothetical protein [Streptomyces sp. B-S-A6]
MTTTVRLSLRSKDETAADSDEGAVRRKLSVQDGAPVYGMMGQPYAFPERVLPPGGVEEYRKFRKEGIRTFVLWVDPHRQQLLARVVTRPAPEGEAPTYEILGAAGESLAVVTRKRAFTGGVRTRWTVQQAGGLSAVGRKGSPFWWLVWWLILPIQTALFLPAIVVGGDLARTPRRTKWCLDGRAVLDWADNTTLAVTDERWDPRVTGGLVLLLKSWDGLLGEPWDRGKTPEDGIPGETLDGAKN